MPDAQKSRPFFLVGEGCLLVGVLSATVLGAQAREWHPLGLVALLAALAIAAQLMTSSVGGSSLTPAHIAYVLAMVLLGPSPAVAIALFAVVFSSLSRRIDSQGVLNNVTAFAAFAYAGARLAGWLLGDAHLAHHPPLGGGATFGMVVMGIFVVTITLDFVLVVADNWTSGGPSLLRETREGFIPLLPSHFLQGALAGAFAVAYVHLGLEVLIAAAVLLVIFHRLTLALLKSEERADQLEARSIHLANMQFGVLSMLMDALALRDRNTSRHAAAVARHAKALGEDLGLGEEDLDTLHTAALLHDIGKFAWSDRILHPHALTDEDWAVIRRHPREGAELVGKLDGYGAVADAILYHHERIDGGGYPAGLIGTEIPLASRIIAVCSTYDTMTRSSSLGPQMSQQDAIAEMRKIAGRQLDSELVEVFVAMIERREAQGLSDAEVDYESELAFRQRVRKLAQPR